jgi:hypothetical protein
MPPGRRLGLQETGNVRTTLRGPVPARAPGGRFGRVGSNRHLSTAFAGARLFLSSVFPVCAGWSLIKPANRHLQSRTGHGRTRLRRAWRPLDPAGLCHPVARATFHAETGRLAVSFREDEMRKARCIEARTPPAKGRSATFPPQARARGGDRLRMQGHSGSARPLIPGKGSILERRRSRIESRSMSVGLPGPAQATRYARPPHAPVPACAGHSPTTSAAVHPRPPRPLRRRTRRCARPAGPRE